METHDSLSFWDLNLNPSIHKYKAYYSHYDKFPVCQVGQGYLSEKEFEREEKWGGDHHNDQHGMTTLKVL